MHLVASSAPAAPGLPHATLTIGEALRYFATSLKKPNNYLRIVRCYLEFCLEKGYGIDPVSISLYSAGKKGNIVSPVRKFGRFARQHHITRVVADGKGVYISPAANELVLGYISEATHLRGDHSKSNYTKALNGFFRYLEREVAAGRQASFSGRTVGEYVNWLRKEGKSAFTINFYLSAIKQLAGWVIRNRIRLQLEAGQLEALRDIESVKGLAIERGFYKDSLSVRERDELLSGITSPRDKAVVALLIAEGLRTVEVTRLEVGDVDFARKQLWVLGKGKHTRKAVKLFETCARALEQYLQSLNGGAAPAARTEKLFPELRHTHQIRYLVDKYLKTCGLKRTRVSAHSLRHTAGQILIQQGVAPIHVQRQLRHEQFETTQFYIKKQTERDYMEQMPD
jgi:site-specific recombinase XerD